MIAPDIATVAKFCAPDREVDIIAPLHRLSSGESSLNIELGSKEKRMTDEEILLNEEFIVDIADILREEIESDRAMSEHAQAGLRDVKTIVDCCGREVLEHEEFFQALARIMIPHLFMGRSRRAFD